LTPLGGYVKPSREMLTNPPFWWCRDGMRVPDPEEQPTLTVAEAAKLLRVSRDTLYAAVDRGEVPAFRWGRRIVIPTAALRALLHLSE